MLQNDRIMLAERLAESQSICIVSEASTQRQDTSSSVKGRVDNIGLHASDGSNVVGTGHCAGRQDEETRTRPFEVSAQSPQSLTRRQSRDEHVGLSAAIVMLLIAAPEP